MIFCILLRPSSFLRVFIMTFDKISCIFLCWSVLILVGCCSLIQVFGNIIISFVFISIARSCSILIKAGVDICCLFSCRVETVRFFTEIIFTWVCVGTELEAAVWFYIFSGVRGVALECSKKSLRWFSIFETDILVSTWAGFVA